MAKMMNIKINEDMAVEYIDPKNRKRPAYLPDNLYQWRMMLYLSEIKHLNKIPGNLHIQYRINGVPSLGDCFKLEENKGAVSLNRIRLHYFFSETLSIEKLLDDSEIVIRLTVGPDWNKYIGQGSSGTVSHFKNNIENGQRHSSTILVFDNS